MSIEGVTQFWQQVTQFWMGKGNFRIPSGEGAEPTFQLDKKWSAPIQLGLGGASALLLRVIGGKHLATPIFVATALVNLPPVKKEALAPIKETNTYSWLRGLQVVTGALSFFGGGFRTVEGWGLQVLAMSAPITVVAAMLIKDRGVSPKKLKEFWLQSWLGLPNENVLRQPLKDAGSAPRKDKPRQEEADPLAAKGRSDSYKDVPLTGE